LATLDRARLDRREFTAGAEARMAVFEFIEGRGDLGRRRSALGHHSSIDHETKARAGPEPSSSSPSNKPAELQIQMNTAWLIRRSVPLEFNQTEPTGCDASVKAENGRRLSLVGPVRSNPVSLIGEN